MGIIRRRCAVPVSVLHRCFERFHDGNFSTSGVYDSYGQAEGVFSSAVPDADVFKIPPAALTRRKQWAEWVVRFAEKRRLRCTRSSAPRSTAKRLKTALAS